MFLLGGVSVQGVSAQGGLCPVGLCSGGLYPGFSVGRPSLLYGGRAGGTHLTELLFYFQLLVTTIFGRIVNETKNTQKQKHPLHKQLWNDTNTRNSLKSCSLPTSGTFKGIRETTLLSISGGGDTGGGDTQSQSVNALIWLIL